MGLSDWFRRCCDSGFIFTKRDDGKVIFYPNGIYSAGYIISKDEEEKVKKSIHHFQLCGLGTVLIEARNPRFLNRG